MNECICCGDRLIGHLNARRMYWFCPSCHQEMPNPNTIQIQRSNKGKNKLVPTLIRKG